MFRVFVFNEVSLNYGTHHVGSLDSNQGPVDSIRSNSVLRHLKGNWRIEYVTALPTELLPTLFHVIHLSKMSPGDEQRVSNVQEPPATERQDKNRLWKSRGGQGAKFPGFGVTVKMNSRAIKHYENNKYADAWNISRKIF